MSFDMGSTWYADNYWVGFKVATNTTINKGMVVELNSDGTVSPTSGASRNAIGVALANGTGGMTIPIALRGIVWVTANGMISQGSFVVADLNGGVKAFADFSAPATYDQTSVQSQLNKVGTVIGVALDSATAGEQLRILLMKF
jgi:predicted RecA/RadA family phage recombinase